MKCIDTLYWNYLTQKAYKKFRENDHYSYIVDTDGRVFRYNKIKKTMREMKCSQADHKYKILILDGGKTYYYIHRLVYEMFIGPIPEGKVIDHIDNHQSNNCYKNLQAITQYENTKKYMEEVYWEEQLNNASNITIDYSKYQLQGV